MTLSKRARMVLAGFVLVLLASLIWPGPFPPEYEFLYLFIVVIPLGYLIATDTTPGETP